MLLLRCMLGPLQEMGNLDSVATSMYTDEGVFHSVSGHECRCCCHRSCCHAAIISWPGHAQGVCGVSPWHDAQLRQLANARTETLLDMPTHPQQKNPQFNVSSIDIADWFIEQEKKGVFTRNDFFHGAHACSERRAGQAGN